MHIFIGLYYIKQFHNKAASCYENSLDRRTDREDRSRDRQGEIFISQNFVCGGINISTSKINFPCTTSCSLINQCQQYLYQCNYSYILTTKILVVNTLTYIKCVLHILSIHLFVYDFHGNRFSIKIQVGSALLFFFSFIFNDLSNNTHRK